MNGLTEKERKLLKWVLQSVESQYCKRPLASLADVCQSIDLGFAPEELERAYYGMPYDHQSIFLTEYIKAMEVK